MNKRIRELFCAIGIWKAHEHTLGQYSVKFFLPDRSIASKGQIEQPEEAQNATAYKILIGDCFNETAKNAQISIHPNAPVDSKYSEMEKKVKAALLMAPFKNFDAWVKVYSEMLFTEFCRIGSFTGYRGEISYYDYDYAQIKQGLLALLVDLNGTFIQLGSNDRDIFDALIDTISINAAT